MQYSTKTQKQTKTRTPKSNHKRFAKDTVVKPTVSQQTQKLKNWGRPDPFVQGGLKGGLKGSRRGLPRPPPSKGRSLKGRRLKGGLKGGLRGVRGLRLKGGSLRGGWRRLRGGWLGLPQTKFKQKNPQNWACHKPSSNERGTAQNWACHKQSSDKNIPAHNWACHKPSSKKTFLRTTGPANVTHTRVPSHVVM